MDDVLAKYPNESNEALEAQVAALLASSIHTPGSQESRPGSNRAESLRDSPQLRGGDLSEVDAFGARHEQGECPSTIPSKGVVERVGVSVCPDTSCSLGGTPSYRAIAQQDAEYEQREVVIDRNGQPRQAGGAQAEGEWIRKFKVRAEQSLFVYLKGVLGRHFLTPHFHRDTCHFIQQCPPFRKLLLLPREHAKTCIVSEGLPSHILLQPAETNIYFPGLEGSECRILLAGETATMAQKNLRVVKDTFMGNRVFRAFWPGRVWDNERQSPQWNNDGIIIPRANEWPDPSIRAIGVGGAITGARPNVMIKDDLTTFDAANSEVVMDMAIEWHKASRALMDKYEVESGLQSLEFIAATRWAVYDLCSHIIDNDPSVEVNDEAYHRIVRDGRILWGEKYTHADIEQLRTEHGSNFYLLYLNSAADPALTDFDLELVRSFAIVNGEIVFEEDERDLVLERRARVRKERVEEREGTGARVLKVKRGVPLNSVLQQRFAEACGRGGAGIRLRAG